MIVSAGNGRPSGRPAVSSCKAEGLVVILAVGQLAVYYAHKVYRTLEAELVVRGAVDVLLEHVAQPFFPYVEARVELVVAPQRCLELEVHACHDGVDAAAVHLGEAEPALLKEQVAGMLGVVQVVGVVDYALDVALVVADHHPRSENIIHYKYSYMCCTHG